MADPLCPSDISPVEGVNAATVTSVLVPWNTCGMTQAAVLGVPTLVYLPYCFFNIIIPLMTLLVAAIGWKIKKRE